MKGTRKLKSHTTSQLLVALGFLAAVALQAPTELFVAYVVGIGGNSMAFMWGNAQEHKHEIHPTTTTTVTP